MTEPVTIDKINNIVKTVKYIGYLRNNQRARNLLAVMYRTDKGFDMLFSLKRKDRLTLSRRSRAFIRVHHLAVLGLIVWVGYLFAIREIF